MGRVPEKIATKVIRLRLTIGHQSVNFRLKSKLAIKKTRLTSCYRDAQQKVRLIQW